MKKVRLITGVTVEDVVVPEFQDSIMYNQNRVYFEDRNVWGVSLTDKPTVVMDRTAVPIKHWVESKIPQSIRSELGFGDQIQRSEGYIAVYPDIDSSLSFYFKILGSEIKDLKSHNEQQYELRNELIEQNNTLYDSLQQLKTKVEYLQSASLWQRIKWVFTGVKV